MTKTKTPPRLFDLAPRKRRSEFWLIFDVTIAEIVRAWGEAHPESVGEALSKIGYFFQLGKFSKWGSPEYFDLIMKNIIVSSDVPRAASIAFETLAQIERGRETGEGVQ